MSEKSPDGSQSLRRGMQLIEFLSDYPNGCPLARISEKTGLNKSTAHRLLKNLHEMGYVTPTATPGSYRLTCKFISVGQNTLAAIRAIELASPVLERLNAETADTVNFSVREGNHCVLVHKLEPTAGMLRTRSYLGQRMQLYCSGMGKIFLAFSPDSQLRRYWEEESANIVKYTANTIVDLKTMRHELARIREESVSYDREENEVGIGCIAAPIFGPEQRVDYAFSVSLPVFRLDDKRRSELVEIVSAASEAIGAAIGANTPGTSAAPAM